MSRFEQPRRSKKTEVIPSHNNCPTESMIPGINNNNMIYIVVGVSAVAMGISIFLYKEMRKMKTDVIELTKEVKDNEQLTNNTKSIENIDEQLVQIKQILQRMTTPRPQGQPSPEQIQAMRQAQAAAQSTTTSEEPEPEIESDSETEDVCPLPGKKDGKVLQI